MAQWLRICLPTQGTWVWSLVREDPTCRGATKPASHNYWAHARQLPKPTRSRARVLQLLKPTRLEPMLHNKRSYRNEKPVHHNEEKPPLTTTRESPCAAMKTQCRQKNKLVEERQWQYQSLHRYCSWLTDICNIVDALVYRYTHNMSKCQWYDSHLSCMGMRLV